MRGFDGDAERAEALRASLVALLHVFPEHLAKAHPRNDPFDAILRAHKKERLEIPIQALRATGAPDDGFAGMPPRALAWFVPSLLASWLDRAPGPGEEPFGASDIEAIVGDEVEWTEEELAALDAVFEAALDAALATPLRAAREPKVERPLEDGIRVWSLHSPSVPLEVLRVARALGVDFEPLVMRWALDDAPLALDHLLEAVYDTTLASKHFLSHEAVADRLGSAFFEATGERQVRLSKAEATVRRNIARRQD
jgi:hypothetical protein